MKGAWDKCIEIALGGRFNREIKHGISSGGSANLNEHTMNQAKIIGVRISTPSTTAKAGKKARHGWRELFMFLFTGLSLLKFNIVFFPKHENTNKE